MPKIIQEVNSRTGIEPRSMSKAHFLHATLQCLWEALGLILTSSHLFSFKAEAVFDARGGNSKSRQNQEDGAEIL